MTAEFDVCVVGGGPAGATLAIRLARLGHRVAVAEQRVFPRTHIGESLSPAIWPILDSLGVSQPAVRRDAVPVAEAGVRWRTDQEERLPLEERVTVDRAGFDALLLAHAGTSGATVLTPVRAGRPVRTGGGWRVPVADGWLHARFLADASGRRRMSGGQRIRTSQRMLALHARWRGGWPVDGPQTRIDALPEGWLWAAVLPGGDQRVMAFVDPGALVAEGPKALFRRLLAASPCLRPLLDTLPVAGQVEVCDATSFEVQPAVEAEAIRVGEAAFAIDPLSSSGVQTAVQTALAAAATVHTILTPGGDIAAAHEYYTGLVGMSVAHHAITAARLYAEHGRYADQPFWRRRCEGARPVPAPDPSSSSLADLLRRPVRLRAPAVLSDTACLLGDTVTRRRALVAPGLDRPVAFLGGVELAPMLDDLDTAPSLAAAIRRWQQALPPGLAEQVATWLQHRGLLEPVGA